MSSILPVLDKINVIFNLNKTMIYISKHELVNTNIFPTIVHDYSDIYYVYIRPGLKKLLNKLNKLKDNYNLYIWTELSKRYTYLILDNLDIDRSVFKHIFTKKHCVDLDNFYTKDLTRYFTEYQLSQTILLDNSLLNFIPQPSNAFYIPSFRGDGNDKYLNQIIKVLEHLKNREDIRPYLLKINNVKKHISEVDFDTWFNYLDRQYERKIAYKESFPHLSVTSNKYPKLF